MPAGIINDDNHETAPAPVSQKLSEERQKSDGVEFLAERSHQAPIGVPDCPENTNTLAGRRMKNDRIGILRWHPHGATGAMLLEMAFIFIPEINPRISGVSTSFF